MSKVQLKAVHQIAARLANTGQVLDAWSKAIEGEQDLLQRRLARAVRELNEVVGALTLDDLAFLELEQEGAGATLEEKAALELGPEVVATTGDDLGLHGRSEMISLVEMVAFLSSLGRNGVLRAHTPKEHYVLELTGGFLTYVTVAPKSAELHLGRILVSQGALEDDAMERGARDVREGEFLGEALVRQRLVTPAALQRALARQALLAFCRMHRVGTGFDFQFEEQSQVLEKKDVRLRVSGLLLESARLNDEAERDGTWSDSFDEAFGEATEAPSGREEDTEPAGAAEEGVKVEAGEAEAGDGEPGDAEGEGVEADAPVSGGALPDPEVEEALRVVRELDAFREALQEKLTSEELQLPVLPDGAAQLLSLCWADEFDAEELLAWVNRDQSLCAHILRIANSAAYAPVSPISSLQMAIARLGLDKLREVAMGLTLKQRVFQLPGWEDVIRSLWREAAITSGFAGVIGKRSGLGTVRGATVGLLLDVGKPIVLNALYEIQGQVDTALTRPVAEALMEEFHGEIGELLAESWQLPEWLSVVMRHHHDYSHVEEHRAEAVLGHFSFQLARWAAHDMDNETLLALPVVEELALPEKDLNFVLEQRAKILQLADVYA